MYCPNCGQSNSNEKKFCRTCGLALDETVRSLVAQKGESLDVTLDERTKTVDRLLTVFGIGGAAAFLTVLVGTIVFKIILEKGNLWSGIGLITFMSFSRRHGDSRRLSRIAPRKRAEEPQDQRL